jgi:hypothetical protein
MTPPVLYSIDTSALLDGWIRYYPPDVFPPVWDRLSVLIEDDRMIAPDEVREELKRKLDGVHKWARGQKKLFVPLDPNVQAAAAEVLRAHPRLIDNRADRTSADPFVIAIARTRGAIVVTGERRTDSLKRPNIPDVCQAIGVPCLGMMELFRKEKWTF